MYNYFLLIGKKVKIEKIDNSDDKIITIKVQRSFKESDGSIKTDDFRIFCTHWIIDHIDLSKVDTLSIKGRINLNENNSIELIAEKIIFFN